MPERSVRQTARKAARAERQRKRDRRLAALAIEVLTALGERDAASPTPNIAPAKPCRS